ncbi:MAG: pyridoxal-phosphate dependent enzyme [Thermoleophilia bacterium]|nr:pyridoxal-phosphate dependent enzyme [Thermoleophilia bacterium]
MTSPSSFPVITDLIGGTPIVRLQRMVEPGMAELLLKLEMFNPGYSVKDRIGVRMIDAAERDGILTPGGTIVEPTSGNTGIGLAMTAIERGYRCVFVMPDKISLEKQNLLRAYGAEVIVCPTSVEADDPRSYYSVSDKLAAELPNAVKLDQYNNPANPLTHYETTGPELWEQVDGNIDAFVAGIGTGGTITGVGRYLKERNPLVKLVGVDPPGSIYTDPSDIHSYLVEGIGEDFWPTTFDFNIVDQWIQVSDRDSFVTANRLAREEAILAGGSCGTALFGALQVAREMGEGKRVVCLLPDSGRGYLSKVYNPQWLVERGMIGLDEAKELTPTAALELLAASGVVL